MTTMRATDVEQLLGDLRTAVNREHRRRRRRRGSMLAAFLVVVCTAGVGIAGTYADWWTNAPPPVHPKQVAEAIDENTYGLIAPDAGKKATVATTPDAALVAVATKSGGYCLIPSLNDHPNIGNSCTSQADDELRAYSSPPNTTTPHWIVYGRIIDPHAATLDLSGLGISQPVPLQRGGFFLFDVAPEQWALLDDRHGAMRILNSSGGVVSVGCAWLGPAPGAYLSGNRWGMLGGPGDSCDQHVPPPIVVEVAKARKLVELKLSEPDGIYKAGDTIAIWQAPSTSGQTCFFLDLAGAQPTRDSANWPDCNTSSSRWSASRPIDAQGSAGLVDGDHYSNMVRGFVDPRSGIVRMSLESPSGAKDIAFGGGAYIAELPNSPRAGKGPGPIPGGPYTIVGYDANGARVAAVTTNGQPVP
jgi:hypothetical protein